MRNPLSIIFGKKRQQTALEQWSSRLSPQAILSIYCTSSAELRLAKAVSVNALYTATDMVRAVIDQGAKFRKMMGPGGRPVEWRDAALFEAVAYAHGNLEFGGGKEGSTAKSSPDPIYDDAMRLSAAITGGLLAQDMVPTISRDAVPLRAAQYRALFDKNFRDAIEEVEFSLVQAFAYGDRLGWRTAPPDLDFALDTVVSTVVKIEQVSMFGALIEISRNLHAKGDELLREWTTGGRR